MVFSIARPGQEFDETKFEDWLKQVDGGKLPSMGLFAAARRLHFEAEIVRTVEVPFWPPCFYWFFGSCFGGHDEASLLALVSQKPPLRGGNDRKPPPPHTMCHTPHWASAGRVAFYYFVFLKRRKCIRGHFFWFLASAVVLCKGSPASAGASAGIRACVGRYVNQNGCFSGPCLATLLSSRNRKSL